MRQKLEVSSKCHHHTGKRVKEAKQEAHSGTVFSRAKCEVQGSSEGVIQMSRPGQGWQGLLDQIRDHPAFCWLEVKQNLWKSMSQEDNHLQLSCSSTAGPSNRS